MPCERLLSTPDRSAYRMQGMSLIAPAGPDPFIRRPNPVQSLRGWTPARGKESAKKAPHPVRWSHNTRTARRRFRCGGRDRQKRDTAYPGECRVVYLSAADNSTGPRIAYNAPVTSPCKGAML